MTNHKDWFDEYLERHPKFNKRWQKSEPRREIVGQLLRLRINRKWTQSQMAQATGVPSKTIANIESGVSGGRIDTLLKIVDAMGCEIIIRERRCS